jgi:hypothetical protein
MVRIEIVSKRMLVNKEAVMINSFFIDLAKLIVAFILAFLQSDAAAAHASMITVGDEIDGMTLTTGAADARPLWVFCASDVQESLTTAHCHVPQVSRLAIGHVFLGTDAAFQETEWSDLNWELYLDDQYINLHQFGTYDYLLPTMAPNPSLVREVFMKFTAWDVVLTNLQPGAHTIEGRVFDGAEEYRWLVHLLIEGDSNVQQQEYDAERIQFGCPRGDGWLSRFHGSCRMYG